MERWVLENVEFLAKEYAIYFRRQSCARPKQKEPSPTKKYARVQSKIAQNLQAQEKAAEIRF